MFIGHFGIALAAKKAAPRTSLGMLVFATEFLDLLWPILLLLGVEHMRIVPGMMRMSPFDLYDYPWSHSLLMTIVWSIAVGGLYYAVRRDARAAWVIGFSVLSHWILDLLVHRPDLALWPGGAARCGLGLWNSAVGSVLVEMLIFACGLWIYVSMTRTRDRTGVYAFWAFVVLLFIGWVSSLMAGAPPNVTSVAWGGLSMWLMVLWAWWADSHREPVGA